MSTVEWSPPQDLTGSLPVIAPPLFSTERTKYAVEFDRKNALSRALNPDYAGLSPDNYKDITYDMVEHVQPKNLAPFLIGVQPSRGGEGNTCQVSYYAGRQLGEVCLAVTPLEARTFPRFVGALRGAAKITTAATVTTEFPTNNDREREERSGQHVHEEKLKALNRLRNNVYLPQRELLGKLIEASDGRHFGLARLGSEMKMREAMATLDSQIFGDIVRAYSRQRNLSESQTQQVQRAITVSMYFDRANNRHLGHFADLVRFARAYNGHKLAAAEQRIEALERGLH